LLKLIIYLREKKNLPQMDFEMENVAEVEEFPGS
jgi:hypothetical protein